MRRTWLVLLVVVALIAAYAFGIAPAALLKRTGDDAVIEGRIADRPDAARPDFGEPEPRPPSPPPRPEPPK